MWQTMRLWYPLLNLILYVVFCCEAQNNESITKLRKSESLLKFLKLNSDRQENTGHDKRVSILSSSRKCEHDSTGIFGNKLCTKKHKSNAVKKSFRPHDYDDDEDYDDLRGDYDDTPDDEELPEDDVTGSYRSYEDLPPRLRDSESLYDDSSERLRDYEAEGDEAKRRHDYEDESRDRSGYEDELEDERDGWDWEPPRWHHGRRKWRLRHHLDDDDDDDDDDDHEPNYYPQYQYHPLRHAHYHHHQYRHPAVHASYRTFGQAPPSWLPYPQGYQSASAAPATTSYVPYPAGWTTSPAGQTSWQSPYISKDATHLFNAVGPRVVNPYLQNTFTYPQRGTNSFFIPRTWHRISSPPYLEATARNLAASFTNNLPGIAATLPRISNSIYHYTRAVPRAASRTRHYGGRLSGPFLRQSEFPAAVLNRIRELNLH